jgi:hypothetical protein
MAPPCYDAIGWYVAMTTPIVVVFVSMSRTAACRAPSGMRRRGRPTAELESTAGVLVGPARRLHDAIKRKRHLDKDFPHHPSAGVSAGAPGRRRHLAGQHRHQRVA